MTTDSSQLNKYDPFNSNKNNEIDDNKNYEYALVKSDNGPAHLLKKPTKPPLAGPYAFSWIPKPFRYKPKVFLMHEIQNTWLWVNASSG